MVSNPTVYVATGWICAVSPEGLLAQTLFLSWKSQEIALLFFDEVVGGGGKKNMNRVRFCIFSLGNPDAFFS